MSDKGGQPSTPTYRIWKYTLEVKDDPQEVEMPHGTSTALTVQFQRGQLCVWAIVDPKETKMVKRLFLVTTDDRELPEQWNHYIGTVQRYSGSMVLHVFQLTDYLTEQPGPGG